MAFKLAFDGPVAVEALARLGFGHRRELQRLLKPDQAGISSISVRPKRARAEGCWRVAIGSAMRDHPRRRQACDRLAMRVLMY